LMRIPPHCFWRSERALLKFSLLAEWFRDGDEHGGDRQSESI
jgi:hypothetical protein